MNKKTLLLRAAYGILTNAIYHVDHDPFDPDWYVDDEHGGHTYSTDDALKILRKAFREVKEELEKI